MREVDLVFERVGEKPERHGNDWIMVPVHDEQYALYRDSGAYPRKMYLSREEAEELLGLVAEELDLKVRFETR